MCCHYTLGGKAMKYKLHLLAAILSTVCIATFFTSSIVVELFGTKESVSTIKSFIVTPGLFILVPAMALVGGTGFIASKNINGQLVTNKKKRMPFIVVNGLFILTPCAILLSLWSSTGTFDSRFYIVQGVELLAGAINLVLMGLNTRDGLRMTGRGRRNQSS